MIKKVTTYFLEMTSPDDLRPSILERDDIEVKQAKIPSAELDRFLYTSVGGDWYWVDRLTWTFEDWLQYVYRPEFETWLVFLSGTPCGYFKLDKQSRSDIEIANFGLLPRFTGQKIGGHLLTVAVKRAWQIGATRIWLHTCTLDHPSALPNYLARGFRVFREESHDEELPDDPPGPLAWR